MPIHDWTRVDSGIFHHFHQGWMAEIANALNGGGLPNDYFALAEQVVSGPFPDVVTLQKLTTESHPGSMPGGVAVADAPPKARFTRNAPSDPYVGKANRIVIRHRLGRVVAVIEIVSPGNKDSRHALQSFAQKAFDLLIAGVNLLIVDLFPASRRDPQGIHPVIWSQIEDDAFELPADKPLTIAAYTGGAVTKAYVEPVAVGDALPLLPIFLDEYSYVPAPLESTYELTWSKCPQLVRELVSNPADIS